MPIVLFPNKYQIRAMVLPVKKGLRAHFHCGFARRLLSVLRPLLPAKYER
jgi:hypothetical protein